MATLQDISQLQVPNNFASAQEVKDFVQRVQAVEPLLKYSDNSRFQQLVGGLSGFGIKDQGDLDYINRVYVPQLKTSLDRSRGGIQRAFNEISGKVQQAQSNVANILDFSNPNLTQQEKLNILDSSGLKQHYGRLKSYEEDAKALGISFDLPDLEGIRSSITDVGARYTPGGATKIGGSFIPSNERTPEQKLAGGRTGEPLTIDQQTFAIKGMLTGTEYGRGANLQEALAKQQQIQGGGTPTISGRPDLLAIPPTAAEGTPQPITGTTGQPVQPRVATPQELQQAGTGTLPSFEAVSRGLTGQTQAQPALNVPSTPSTGTPQGGTMPTTTGTSTITPSSFSAQQQAILDLMKPSDEEMRVQAEIDRLVAQQKNLAASRDLGIAKVIDQPIATPFLQGQSAALQRQAATQIGAVGAQLEPLEIRLAREQSKRAAAFDVKSKEMEFAEKEAERAFKERALEAERQQPFALSPGQTLYDPATGQAIFTAPERTKEIDVLEQQRTQAEIANIYSQISERERKGEPEPVTPYQMERMARNLNSVTELRGLVTDGVTGRSASIQEALPNYLRSRDYVNFTSEIDTLKANIAFGELTAMREAAKTGGALGQVSDKEAQLLSSSLGALNPEQSRESFLSNLQQIEDSITRWQQALGVETSAGTPMSSQDLFNDIE